MPKESFLPSRKPSLLPRNVTSWKNGERQQYANVVPLPFGSEYAHQIWEEARKLSRYGEPSDRLNYLLSNAEIAYVLAVWDTIPNGESSFLSAFWAIMRGNVLT